MDSRREMFMALLDFVKVLGKNNEWDEAVKLLDILKDTYPEFTDNEKYNEFLQTTKDMAFSASLEKNVWSVKK